MCWDGGGGGVTRTPSGTTLFKDNGEFKKHKLKCRSRNPLVVLNHLSEITDQPLQGFGPVWRCFVSMKYIIPGVRTVYWLIHTKLRLRSYLTCCPGS